jgi:hypothetical protein
MQEFHLDASRFGCNLYNGDPDFSVIPNTHPQAFPYGQGKWIRGISQKKSAFKRNNSKKSPKSCNTPDTPTQKQANLLSSFCLFNNKFKAKRELGQPKVSNTMRFT